MDNNEKLELIKISAIDFEGFKKKYITLTLSEQNSFNAYIETIQNYLKDIEKKRIEEKTGFPPPG